MIVHVDFRSAATPATPFDHAVREAARCYADQLLDGRRAAFPLGVRDMPADAAYQRTPLVVADALTHLDLGRLPGVERDELDARNHHERLVALAGALAFGRQVGQTPAALADGLTARGRMGPLADVVRLDRQLRPLMRATESELWLTVHIGRVDRFLDRNWRVVEQLATLACRAPVDADGWHLLAPEAVAAQLRRRPVALSPDERSSIERRRGAARIATGRTLARRLGLTRD